MDRIKIDISDYDKDFKKQFKNRDLVAIDEILSTIEDLLGEVEDLEQKIKKLENPDWEEDYIPEDY